MMMNAMAVHCVASVGFGKAIITVNISIDIPRTTEDQSIMARLPNFSIVPGVTGHAFSQHFLNKNDCDLQ